MNRKQSRTKTLSKPAGNSVLGRLSAHQVVVPKRKEVQAYLRAHNGLSRLLPAIGAQVRQAFGAHVQLSLELYRDPEIDDRYLTLYVRQQEYDSKIMERIESVSSQFNRKLERVPGYLLLTTDFRRPRAKDGV